MNNYNCPHLTGVVCNGYEECDFGKACDFDCEWIEIQKYKQKLEKIKKIINFLKTIPNCDGAYYCQDKLDKIQQIIEGEK